MTVAKLFNRGSLFCLLLLFSLAGMAQSPRTSVSESKADKPYKILTNGRQITIQSNKNIESVMVWTAGGHRVVEDKGINKTDYRFQLTIDARIYFIMIRTNDGKTYSDKIGIR